MNDSSKYPALNLPAFDFKVRSIEEQIQIFDAFRKKFVALTPEEWVRQHFAHFLVAQLYYPASRIQLEFQIKYHRKVKRPDLVVVNDFGKPHILVECKAPGVVLNEDVFLQLTTYFQVLKPTYMVMTNGLQHIVATTQLNTGSIVYLEALPMNK